MTIKVFEAFAGYGSQSLALEQLGIEHKVVAISEIDKYAIQVYYALHDKDIPNLDIYTTKYKKFKKNDFELGYFIHLYTDKLWYEKFMPKIAEGTSIKLLDGTIINAKEEQITNMIYSDYTNINIQIIENHNMDLSLFYEEFQKPKTIIDEIPIDKLDILINKMGIIIENSKQEQTYSFDTYLVEDFIKDTVKRTKEVLETKY